MMVMIKVMNCDDVGCDDLSMIVMQYFYRHILDQDTRKRQGLLAKQAGIFGFIFYHFWFSGKASPPDHKVMFKVPGNIHIRK